MYTVYKYKIVYVYIFLLFLFLNRLLGLVPSCALYSPLYMDLQ